jgi:hypothetical protein
MKRKKIDWPKIEAEYRTGTYSNRALASKHGISEGALRYRIKNRGLTKDLKTLTQERTEKRLRSSPACEQKNRVRKQKRADKSDGRRKENKELIINPPVTKEQIEAELALSEAAIKEAVDTKVTVIETHRLDIHRARVLLEHLLAELALGTITQDEINEIADEMATKTNSKGEEVTDAKKLLRFKRALSLNTRSATLRNLVIVLEKVVTLERQAFGINEEFGKEDGSPDSIILGEWPLEDEDDSE